MILTYWDNYHDWLKWADDETKIELLSLTDSKDIEDRFYKNLEFGTGGMRGIMGAGSNRMNKYVVRKATKGLADYLHNKYSEAISRGIVIAYDSRNHSKEFALETACVLCSAGIPVKLFEELEPTPLLSFAVKYLHAIAGIVITASHNPKEYNGYKVYDEYGDQIVPNIANELSTYINAVNDLSSIDVSGNVALLEKIGESVVEAFLNAVYEQSIFQGKVYPLKIVYTPLHGAGNKPVRRILDKAGFKDINIVVEQESPDGNFSTVKSPNPEEKSALTLGLVLGKRLHADIVIGTDPDSDRIGVGIYDGHDFILLSGNQIGALLVDFIFTMRRNTISPFATLVKTVVTGELGADIARKKGIQVVETLTGFKYIGEKITKYRNDTKHDFIMGYEESYGYLVGTHSQDKDAVVAALLICEMASYYKQQGKTLVDVLKQLYAEYGYYYDALDSYTLKGKDGLKRIGDIMDSLRQNDIAAVLPDIHTIFDYNEGINGLPKENLLKFIMTDGSWFAIRPSGTEPKIKIYYSIKAKNEEQALTKLKKIKIALKNIIGV